jgi:hypothetical protein
MIGSREGDEMRSGPENARKPRPLRTLVRGFWVVLAVLFLIEAWLWSHLEPVVERLVALLPWRGLKAALVRLIAGLSPPVTLIVFAIPFFLLMPVKFLEVWLIVTKQWIAATIVLVLAKLVGVGLTAFIFEATKDKLLQMAWFRRVYDYFIWLRAWAHQKVDPITRRLRKWRHVLWHFHSGRFTVRLLRVRRRMRLAAAS